MSTHFIAPIRKRIIVLSIVCFALTVLFSLTAHADSGDEICFPLYRKTGAIPGVIGCELTASTASVNLANYSCTSSSGVDRIVRYCGMPPKGSGANCSKVGDPCNAGTGNQFQIEVDYFGGGSTLLALKRYYNSTLAAISGSAFGTQWRSNYDRQIIAQNSTQILVTRPDGKGYYFILKSTTWATDSDTVGRLTKTASGWQYINEIDETELYDTSGKLLSITQKNGMAQTLAYSTAATPVAIAPVAGLLISVTDPSGRHIDFAYDALKRVKTMTDSASGQYAYGYNSGNNLSTVKYPDTTQKTYLYNETGFTSGTSQPNVLTGIVDEAANRFANLWYDVQGRNISSEHAGSADKVTLAYNSNGTTTVVDALNTTRVFNFVTVQKVVRNAGVTAPCAIGDCLGKAIAYDTNGNIASRTDFNGVVTTYVYDLARNLETSRTEASGTPQARTVSTVWDSHFRLPTQISEAGRTTTNSYDPSYGTLLSQRITDTATGSARTTTYTYTTPADNTLPNLLKTIDGPRTDVADITTYSYTPNGDLMSVTNAIGQTTQLTQYDANGRPLSLTDPNGLTTTLSYTPRGWLANQSVGSQTTAYSYDSVGQLTQISLPDGQHISYTYDAAHRLTDIQDGFGNHLHYTLDGMGNRTQTDTYDSSGTLVATHRRSFDALNRLYQDIGALNQTTTYQYDAGGNLKTVTDPLNHSTAYQYDALNRLIQSTDAASGVTQYGYDPLDQLKRVTDPRNLVTSYSVNALGDQTQLASPDTGVTNKTYDSAGNLKTSTDARGMMTTYTYDALNRVTGMSYANGSSVTFTYDSGANALGRLTKMSDPTGTTTWSYNTLGRVAAKTQVTQRINLTTAYSYDAAGRLSSLTYPSGNVVSYGYNAQGQIANIAVGGVVVASVIQYQPFGSAKSWTWGNGLAYARSFDRDGRIASYPLATDTRTLSYDAGARLSGYTDTQPATSQSFVYDNLDRLTSWIAPNTNQSFSYDANGNRTGFTLGATQSLYTYPPTSNRLTAISGGNTDSLSYDAAGNILIQANRRYRYDASGRLSTLFTPGMGVDFEINGLGQRVHKYGINNTLFLYDERGHLMGEYSVTGVPIQETIYLDNMPLAVIKSGEPYYIYSDQLGAPRVITNTSNIPVWRWDSDPFGAYAANENPSGLGTFSYNLRFPGQYYDQETGLNYNGFRDYDPSTGRYVQSDPIGLYGGINTYSYVSGNPLSYVDPLGLETTVVCRSVEDWKAKALGAKHCFVVVWHWDNANGQCTERKIIDRQYSLAGNPKPFPQDSKAPTFQSDRNTWNSGSGANYDISPPPGQTVPGFDAAVTNKGNSYNSNNGYNATFGPNSNTATQQIIQGAGGTLPNIPGAYGQYYQK